MKAAVAAFNQEKALVGAFSVITNPRMELFGALIITPHLCRLALRLALDQAGPARQPALPVQRSHAAPRHRAEAGQIFLVRCKYFYSFISDILYSQFPHLALVGQGLVEGGEAPALAVTADGPRPAHPGILAAGGEGWWWVLFR